MSTSTSVIATIVVVAILLFFLFWGFRKGFLRILLTTMALVATIILAGILAPPFSEFLSDTFIGKGIEKKVNEYVEAKVDEPIADRAKDTQDKLIDKLPLPKFIREDISEKNTISEYFSRKVSGFTEYLKERLADSVLKAVAYVILFIIIFLAFRILLRVTHMVNRIPIIGGINRILGAALGLLEGLLIVWCAALLIMMFANTPFGAQAIEVINGNAFLKFLYDKNGITLGMNALFKTFL